MTKMKMTREIKVTREHIRKGMANIKAIRDKTSDAVISTSCPVALAAEDALGVPVRVGVLTMTVTGLKWTSGFLPHEVSDFIHRVDSGKHVEPITFTITIN
jgi:hypothetical protein